MRKPSTDLFDLIVSMTPDEKRFFRSFCRPFKGENQSKNLLLFELIDRQKAYDEKALKAAMAEDITDNQFAVLKSYLYQTLLKALSAYLGERGGIKKIRQQFRMLEVLFHKELSVQYEKLFEKIKVSAEKFDHPAIHLEVLDWERRIWNKQFFNGVSESDVFRHQQILRQKMEALNAQGRLQNLHLQFMFLLRTKGYLRSTSEYQKRNAILLNDRMLKDPAEANSLAARIMFQHIWGLSNMMAGNARQANAQLGELITQIDQVPNLAYDYFELYVTLVYNFATTCLLLDEYENLKHSINKLERLKTAFSAQKARIFYCTVLLKTEYFMGTVQFNEALAFVVEASPRLASHFNQLSPTEYVSVAFTIAYLHFAHREYRTCHRIIQQEMRPELVGKNPDLQIAVGMLTLILYFEMGEDELFVRSYRSLYRVLMKWQDRYSMEINILKSIRKFPLLLERITEAEFFSNLKAQIQMIREDPQHGRAVQYFNFDTWLESKIKGTSILEVIRSLMQNN